MGPLSNANEKYFKDKQPFWNLNIAHSTYDEVWQSRASRSGTLTVGTGAFAPIKPEVWNFEVSGLQIVPSWLGYRMKKHRGKQSSPLDHIHATAWTASFTTEFLRLLWIVEATLLDYPKQQALLEAVVGGPVFRDRELAPVPDDMREAPAASGTGGEQKETQYRIAFSDVL